MKPAIFFRLFICVILVLVTKSSIAQRRINCGPEKTDTALLVSIARMETGSSYRPAVSSRMVSVFIHILYNDNGYGGAIAKEDAYSEFAMLVADYSSDNLCFFLAGVDTIDNTFLNLQFNADTDDPGVFDPYQVPNCLNIFYVSDINGNNNACSPPCGYGGIALGGIPGTFCLVDDGNVGGHTISHEIGHCLGLSHTFARINGRECIDGSNSASAGDLITDTPADPFSWNSNSCYSESPSGCTYTGNCEDPCGSSQYTPPYNNIMSYWNDCIPQVFSGGQFTRVNYTIDNIAAISNCSSPANYTQNAVNISSGYLIKAARNTFSTNGSIIISSSAVASFGGTEAVLSPGFQATPSGLGSTTIKVTGCN